MASQVVRSKPKGKTVLIAGAGVGGLMTALECWRRGFNVRIIERSPENISTGDSFQVGNSALRELPHWPLLEQKLNEARYSAWFTPCNQIGEKQAPPMRAANFIYSGPDSEETRSYRYSRPDFHSALLAQVEEIGLRIEYGNVVKEYFEDATRGKAGVIIGDGSKLEADLVVAADGVRGASALLVAGRPVPARSSGKAIFRTAMPIEEALKVPGVDERWPLHEGKEPFFEMWMGPGLGAAFGRTHERFEWFIFHEDTGSAAEHWSNTVEPEEVLKLTTAEAPDWPKIVEQLIRAAPGGKLLDWKLMWRDPQPKWTSPAGLVVQLGDAAHTFLPSSGNGATQALEDAVSLATCLELAGADKIAEATRVHNLLRFERVSFLMAFGVANQEVRELKINSRVVSKSMGFWLAGHNPAKYAEENYEKARAHLAEGAPFKNTNRPTKVEYQPWTIDSLKKAVQNDEPSIMDGDWE